jgi:phospholipid-binding lipoprotein MlaA
VNRPKVKKWMCILIGMFLSITVSASNITGTEPEVWDEWTRYVSDLMAYDKENPDPLESINRKIFVFNDNVDRIALSPLARGFDKVTPDVAQRGIGNVFSNLLEVTTIFNDLLQLKFGQAASDSGRFVLNTTVGFFGLFDVASAVGLEKNNEDLGQTLGYWGVGAGPYVVVPFFGSYTFRDGLGAYGDIYSDYISDISHIPTRNQVLGVRVLDRRASVFAAEGLITGDKYTFLRDAYLQQREYMVEDGVVEDTFGEEDTEWGDEDWD